MRGLRIFENNDLSCYNNLPNLFFTINNSEYLNQFFTLYKKGTSEVKFLLFNGIYNFNSKFKRLNKYLNE